MASPTGTPVGRLRPIGRGARMTRRPSPAASSVHASDASRGPQVPKRNLAARAGYWSARHRKIAIGGWLAFVVIAFVLGGAIGTNTLADEDTGNGSSRVADTAISRGRLPGQGRRAGARSSPRRQGCTVDDPAFQAGVKTVVRSLEGRAAHRRGRSPARQGQRGPDLRGRPLRARHVLDPGRRRSGRRARRRLARRHRGGPEGAPRPADRAVR